MEHAANAEVDDIFGELGIHVTPALIDEVAVEFETEGEPEDADFGGVAEEGILDIVERGHEGREWASRMAWTRSSTTRR